MQILERVDIGPLDEPVIGILCHGQHLIEIQRQRTRILVVYPQVMATSISQDACHIALATWHVPDAVDDHFGHHGRMVGCTGGFLLRVIIGSDNSIVEAIGLSALTHKLAIESHPLGTSQRVIFEIVGTLDDGDVHLGDLAIAGILIGREQDGVGLHVDNLFHCRVHRVATVGNPACCHACSNDRVVEVLLIHHTTYGIKGAQFGQEARMHRGINQCIGDRCAHDGAVGQILWHLGIGRYQHITVQHPTLPRVTHCHDRVPRRALHRQ